MHSPHGKLVGVIGGMGPLATVYFAQRIIFFTPAKCDSDHVPLIIDNRPDIPDRTVFLEGKGESPLPYLKRSIHTLQNAGCKILVMPCNTSHYFIKELQEESDVPIIDMVEETVKEVKKRNLSGKIALIATRGTYLAGIYDKIAEKKGVSIIKPNNSEQEKIMEFLYDVKSGQKVNSDDFKNLLDDISSSKVTHFLSGCTEAPILFKNTGVDYPVLDAGDILAKKAIEMSLGIKL